MVQDVEMLGKLSLPTSGEGEMIFSWNCCLWPESPVDSEVSGMMKFFPEWDSLGQGEEVFKAGVQT